VGNAGNITAYWRGYREYFEAKLSRQLPRMLGFQAEGAAPIVRGAPVEKPETFATAIRIGNPASWQGAVDARDQSGGLIDMVSEDELREAYKMLASLEGVFAEPASAAGVAGLRKLARQGFFDEAGSSNERVRVVCTLTGHGLKDPDSAISASAKPETIEPNISAAAKLMGLET
jgi:threonine synthase